MGLLVCPHCGEVINLPETQFNCVDEYPDNNQIRDMLLQNNIELGMVVENGSRKD